MGAARIRPSTVNGSSRGQAVSPYASIATTRAAGAPLAEVTEHGVGLLAEQHITTVTTVRSG